MEARLSPSAEVLGKQPLKLAEVEAWFLLGTKAEGRCFAA